MNVNDLKGKTIAFAASGGLDSVTVVSWLVEQGVNVICFTANFGQPDEEDLTSVKERMLSAGAQSVHLVDLRHKLAVAGLEVVKSQAFHRGRYWNTTGAARHVLVKAMLEKMEELGIEVLSHGCTGRGNDQVRFQHITNLLQPKFQIYAPWRDSQFLSAFRGRSEMIVYCQQKGLSLKSVADAIYSTDSNLLGLTHEAGILESLSTPARSVTPMMGIYPENAKSQSEVVSIRFENGTPVAVNGETLEPVSLISRANRIAGEHGIGLAVHLVEDRIIGIKSRGVYEAPGLELLGSCHEFLVQMVLDETAHNLYRSMSQLVADQIYRGRWFDHASSAARSAIDELLNGASGEISVRLYRGTVSFERAENLGKSLYNRENSSMEAVGSFDHSDSEGYLKTTGQSVKTAGVVSAVNTRLLNIL
jgi:argininosuccinate synthase